MKDQKNRRSFHLSGIFLLFHRNGFCQVSRLIHITATSHCHIVSKQLQRNDRQGIGKVRIRLGNVYHIIRCLLDGFVALDGNRHDKSASCLYLYHITDGLLEQSRLGCQSHYQGAIFDQGNGAMLQFSGCISLGMNIGDLF